MPRDGAIIFGNLIGKLDVLRLMAGDCPRNDGDGVQTDGVISPLFVFIARS